MFSLLFNKPVILYSLEAFQKAESIDGIIVAARPENVDKIKELCAKNGVSKLKAVVSGGGDRRRTVYNGLCAITDKEGFIAVHDGARPLITPRLINAVMAAAAEYGAAVPAVKARDTVKEADGEWIRATLDRERLYEAQTPQAFDLPLYRRAAALDAKVTDDGMLVEKLGVKTRLVEGDYANIKITSPGDLIIAEALIKNGVN